MFQGGLWLFSWFQSEAKKKAIIQSVRAISLVETWKSGDRFKGNHQVATFEGETQALTRPRRLKNKVECRAGWTPTGKPVFFLVLIWQPE